MHTGFVSKMQQIDTIAGRHNVKIHVTSSARANANVQGAIVTPAKKSNHVRIQILDLFLSSFFFQMCTFSFSFFHLPLFLPLLTPFLPVFALLFQRPRVDGRPCGKNLCFRSLFSLLFLKCSSVAFCCDSPPAPLTSNLLAFLLRLPSHQIDMNVVGSNGVLCNSSCLRSGGHTSVRNFIRDVQAAGMRW